jgi:hypothetical protein
MKESTKLNHCANCFSHCRPVCGILLILLGLLMLGGKIGLKIDQNRSLPWRSAVPSLPELQSFDIDQPAGRQSDGSSWLGLKGTSDG